MVDDETHGVEISIAGCVGEMVRANFLGSFFVFCFNHSILFKGTNSHAALAMAKKPLNQQQVSPSDQGSKPETLRPSGMGQTARQLHKSKEIHREEVTRKPLPTSRQKRG